MKLVGILATALLLAAPVAAGAQGHGGGLGAAHVGIVHAGPHGHGGVGRGGQFHGRFRGGGLLLWGYPYWGWDCAADSIGCDMSGDPGASPTDVAYASGAPRDPSCGAWVRRAGGYAWAPDACDEPPAAADPPPHPTMAANECSDWVWRADLHHSVCKRQAAG